jgi:hypothetical protein
MGEVVATLRFLSPCLGNVRTVRKSLMLRGEDGKVIFMQTWWRAGLGYAAQALGRWQNEVSKIQTAPEIEGTLGVYNRYYTEKDYQEHEAYVVGSSIKVRFCLPPRLNLEAFKELLTIAGEYVGISPFGYRQDYGRFKVLDVEAYCRRQRRRRRVSKTTSKHHADGKPDSGLPTLPPLAVSAATVSAALGGGWGCGDGGIQTSISVQAGGRLFDGSGRDVDKDIGDAEE